MKIVEKIPNHPYTESKKVGDYFMKPNLFISHITEEKELAKYIKEHFTEKFMGGFNIFVSSDGESIGAGTEWFNTIKVALENADAMIVLISKDSLTRPWIPFELGVGWMKKIPVIPLCHTDMIVGQLPSPINQLQAKSASNNDHLMHINRTLNDVLYSKTEIRIPEKRLNDDDDEFLRKVVEFERIYGFNNKVLRNIATINDKAKELEGLFDIGNIEKEFTVTIQESKYRKIEPCFLELMDLGILKYSENTRGNVRMDGNGFIVEIDIILSPKLKEVLM